jgi:hypothetical protein
MMGTWLPETCWATSRREINNTKVTSSWFILPTLNYDARSTTHQISFSVITSTASIRLRLPQLSDIRIACVVIFVILTYLAVPYFVTMCHKRKYFWGKKLLNIKCVSIFPTTLKHFSFWEVFSEKISKFICRHLDTHSLSQILRKHGLLRQIFEKYWNTKFHENPSSGTAVVPYGLIDRQTDWQGEANSRFSYFF